MREDQKGRKGPVRAALQRDRRQMGHGCTKPHRSRCSASTPPAGRSRGDHETRARPRDLSHGGPPIPYTPPPGRACQGNLRGRRNEACGTPRTTTRRLPAEPRPDALAARRRPARAPGARGLAGAPPRVHLARLDRASLRLLPLLDANLRRHGIDDPLGDALALARERAAARNRTLFEGGRRSSPRSRTPASTP